MPHAPATFPVVQTSGRPPGRSGLLNSVLGTIGLILAFVIVAHELIDSNVDPTTASRPDSLAMVQWTDSPVFMLAWSPDGQRLAASGFGPIIRIWEPKTGKSRALENATDQARFVLGWSQDGGCLIVGGLDIPVESWATNRDPEDPAEVLVQPDDPGRMADVLAIATRGRSIRLWGPSDGRIRLLPTSCRLSNSVAYSPDGFWMASGATDGTFQIRDLRSGEDRQIPSRDSRGINSIAFSPDSSKIVSGGGGPIRLWDVASGQEMAKLGDDWRGSATVAISPDGRRVAGATWDGSIRVWDVSTRREQFQFQGHFGQVLALAWSPDGKTLASGGYDSTVRLWDVTEPTEVARDE